MIETSINFAPCIKMDPEDCNKHVIAIKYSKYSKRNVFDLYSKYSKRNVFDFLSALSRSTNHYIFRLIASNPVCPIVALD